MLVVHRLKQIKPYPKSCGPPSLLKYRLVCVDTSRL